MQQEDNRFDDLFRKRLGNKEMKVSNPNFLSNQEGKIKASSSTTPSSHLFQFSSMLKSVLISCIVVALIVGGYFIFNDIHDSEDGIKADLTDSIQITEQTFIEDILPVTKADSLDNALNEADSLQNREVVSENESSDSDIKEETLKQPEVGSNKKNVFHNQIDMLQVKDSIANNNADNKSEIRDTANLSVPIIKDKQLIKSEEVTASADSIDVNKQEIGQEEIVLPDSLSTVTSESLKRDKKDDKSKKKKERKVKKLR